MKMLQNQIRNFLGTFCLIRKAPAKKQLLFEFLPNKVGGGGGVKAVQQKSKVELLFLPCGFPKGRL